MTDDSPAERRASALREPVEPAGAPAGECPPTILVVDDEPSARQLLSDLLEAQGFRVTSTAQGQGALCKLEGVDLVLLDAMLPDRDGWSICREIKARHDPLLPVIMVTARTAPDDVVRTFDAGADDYIAKPFHAAELTARIESRLRVHRAERALQQMNRRLAELANQNYELYQKAAADSEEREHLLREIDHRVRNNLAAIMGLVSMERIRWPPRPATVALVSLENRLRSFLVVHETLRSRRYRTVPVRDVAERIAQKLRNGMGINGRIRLEFSGQVADLSERQGFDAALVLNELITNALRHGFPDERPGTIAVHLEDRDGNVRIEIADDGVGFPPGGDPELRGSGRSIVQAVVTGNLNGNLEFASADRGVRVVLTFPRDGA